MAYFRTLLSSKAHTLRFPKEHKDDVDRLVRMHQSSSVSSEMAPFHRQLDLWAFAIATAVSLGLPPLSEKSAKWGRKFADTRSVDMGESLCEILAVLALTTLGPEHDSVDRPAEIVEVGNRLAGAGVPEVLKRLKDPDLRTTTLDKAIEFAAELHRSTE